MDRKIEREGSFVGGIFFIKRSCTIVFLNGDSKHAVEKKNRKCKGDRSIEAPEKKGGNGVHSLRILLFDGCQCWGIEREFHSLFLQDGKLVR